MVMRKKTLRRLSPVARKVARLAGEADSIGRRLKNMVVEIGELEAARGALKTARQSIAPLEMPDSQIHCPDCLADEKVFCPRDPDAKCLICHKSYCGAHIGLHLAKEHCVALNLDHCSE